MKIKGQSPAFVRSQIAKVCAEVFFPDLDETIRAALLKLRASDNAWRILSASPQAAGHVIADAYYRETTKKAQLLLQIATEFSNGFDSWYAGFQEPFLDVWPGQELFLMIKEARDGKLFPERWRLAGGNLFDNRMIALKWDPIWSKISTFDLPFPPLQVVSGYAVREIAYSEAKSLGLAWPLNFKVTLDFDIDFSDFRKRLIQDLERMEAEKRQRDEAEASFWKEQLDS